MFYAGGQEVQSNYSCVDTTDPSTQGDPGTSPSFSVVGNLEMVSLPQLQHRVGSLPVSITAR